MGDPLIRRNKLSMTFSQILACGSILIFFWILTIAFALGGVILGGWLVYRTKREPYEPMLRGSSKGEAFTIPLDDEIPESKLEDTPESILSRMGDFMHQIGDKNG